MFRTRKEEKEKITQTIEKNEELAAKTEALQQDITGQNKQIQKQQAFLEQLGNQHTTMMARFEQEVTTLQKTNKEARAQVHNLKSAQITVENDVAKHFKQQTHKALQEIETTAKVDTAKIESLTATFTAVVQQFKEAKKTIQQFQELAQTLKTTDFKIKEHAKVVEQANHEKLKLMKRVDELESMLAKFKQRRKGPMF